MRYEYLLLNMIILAGPLIFGIQPRFYFINRWRETLKATAVTALPFIIWDSQVTGTHWNFNPAYVTGVYLFNLPLEEWMFFFTVPFACLFTWEMIKKYKPLQKIQQLVVIRKFMLLLPGIGIILFYIGKEYTGLALIFFGVSGFLDIILKTDVLLQKRILLFIVIVGIFTLLFNGYLTARPIVSYAVSFQLDLRIITIPVEDFIYGFALILCNLVLFEKFLALQSAKKERFRIMRSVLDTKINASI